MILGIRNKLLLVIGSTLVLALCASTYLQINLHKEAFNTELQKRLVLMKQSLNQAALAQATSLRNMAAEDLASFNLFSLTNKLSEAVRKSPELHQAVLVDKHGKVFIHTNNPEQQQKQYTSNHPPLTPEPGLAVPEQVSIGSFAKTTGTTTEQILEYRIPVYIGELNWGSVYFQYTLNTLNKLIEQSKVDNAKLQKTQTTKVIYSALAILLISFVLISQLAERLVEPVIRLSAFAKEIANGNFTKVHNIDQPGKDEISELSQNFSEMALKLEENHLEQAEYNLTLETKVAERTKALNLKNEELLQAFKRVEESQQQLIHSEKMAALGQLIAGIAHEINTPLGAIGASASNTSDSLTDYQSQLLALLSRGENAKTSFFLRILTLVAKNKNHNETPLSTREERKIKRSLQDNLLATHSEEDAERLAEILVEMGLHSEFSKLKPEILTVDYIGVTKLAHSLTSIEVNTNTIHTAIARASKIVFALKNFSHQDDSGKMISSNINNDLETVLTLYQSQFKQGCDVLEDFADLPPTLCFPDELNQVWTNLIHNALQAMNNQGTLKISTRASDKNIIIEFTDNGCGIPLEIQNKVFTSFFTTKPAGEGSGLGLGICKKIIDKHQGDIDFTSKPGQTTFTVSIPIKS